MNVKSVLWVSRHTMTGTQVSDLERVMGGPVRLIPWRDTVKSVEELASVLPEVDAVAAVLPMELMEQLLELADGKPVLQALSCREPTGGEIITPDGRREMEFAFIHRGWQQVLEFRLKTVML